MSMFESDFAKENSFLNPILFPLPKEVSYKWSSYPDGELLCLFTREGDVVPCLLLPVLPEELEPGQQGPRNIIIYCHAAEEDIGNLYEAGQWLCDTLDAMVIIPEYPGFGLAPGAPNEISVMRSVEAAWDLATQGLGYDPARVLFYGRAIGTGPAVAFAARFGCAGLMLVSPFAGVKELLRLRAGGVAGVPVAELLLDSLSAGVFPNAHHIPLVTSPVLIVHGMEDKITSYEESRYLHGRCPAEKKSLILLESVGHVSLNLQIALAAAAPATFPLTTFPPRHIHVPTLAAGGRTLAPGVKPPRGRKARAEAAAAKPQATPAPPAADKPPAAAAAGAAAAEAAGPKKQTLVLLRKGTRSWEVINLADADDDSDHNHSDVPAAAAAAAGAAAAPSGGAVPGPHPGPAAAAGPGHMIR